MRTDPTHAWDNHTRDEEGQTQDPSEPYGFGILATEPDAMREFAANLADPDPDLCLCRGRGWALTSFDTWEPCPIHFHGQPHPENSDWNERGTA